MKFQLFTVTLFVLLLHKCNSQLSQAQPCLVCGDAVLRIWSLMSRLGDKYLRITDVDNNGDKVIDCAGILQDHNFTSLLKISEKSSFQETRVRLLLALGDKQYHLYAKSTADPLLGMVSNNAEQLTDNSNLWAPERLLYEHQLFTVFQSVKFRGYYVSCDGSGVPKLQKVINTAYREPNQLFLTIDPGNAIRAVSFGANQVKREIFDGKEFRKGSKHYSSWTQYLAVRNGINKETSSRKSIVSLGSVTRNFTLPLNITFVLCFWVKTTAKFAQLISITEERIQSKIKIIKKLKRLPLWHRDFHYRPRYRYVYYPKKVKVKVKTNNNIINVTIQNQKLTFEIGYHRKLWTLPNMDIADGIYRQICISLNNNFSLEVYRNSEVIFNQSVPELATNFNNYDNLTKRSGQLMLGIAQGMTGQSLQGSLVQVNLWDKYPPFRIRRIATNCACGGGNLVSWSDLLNGTMLDDVSLDFESQCPRLEGYNYDPIIQNRLI